MATNYMSLGARAPLDLGPMKAAESGGGPPPFVARGLWFTRVWWPILIAGGSTFLAGCTFTLMR